MGARTYFRYVRHVTHETQRCQWEDEPAMILIEMRRCEESGGRGR